MEPDTLMGNAAVLYAAGDWDNWTIGTGNYDGINYGLFYSDWHLERIIKQLRRARSSACAGSTILIGECGHASRSAHDFVPVFGGRGRLPGAELHRVHPGVPRRRARSTSIPTSSPSGSPTTIPATSPARAGSWSSRGRSCKSFVKDFVEMDAARASTTTAAAAAAGWSRWTRPTSSG